MGNNCFGCHKTIDRKPQYSKQPADTELYNPQNIGYVLQKLNFVAQIQNFTIVNYPYDLISMKFFINDIFECHLPRQRKQTLPNKKSVQIGNSNKIKWRLNESFKFSINEYEIRKSFIIISIFRQQQIPNLQLKINLFSVIQGPYHHDIGIKFQNGKYSRLLFDIKISQTFRILIETLKVSIKLNKEYPGDQFNYSFNAYSCSQKILTSEGSISKKASIFSDYRVLRPQDECQSPTKIRKGTDLNKMIKNVMTSQLGWQKSKQLTQNYFMESSSECLEESMPSFKLALHSNHVNKSSLQFILWNIIINPNSSNNQAILFADCNIPISQLFQSNCIMIEERQDHQSSKQGKQDKKTPRRKLESRISDITGQLMHDGKNIGSINIKIKTVSEAHFNQQYLYARTQDGIVYMNSMFKVYSGKQTDTQRNTNIIRIEQIFQRIARYMLEYSQISKQNRNKNWSDFQNLKDAIISEFIQFHNTLTLSLQDSLTLSKKDQCQELLDNQNILLNILERLYIYLAEDETKFAHQCWQVFVDLIKRGEFYLQNIGFSQFKSTVSSYVGINRPSTQMGKPQRIYLRKIQTALRYQEVLYKALIHAFNLDYDNQADTFTQTESYKACCYFRIPKFRQEVLKCIVRKQDNQLFDYSTTQLFQSETCVSTSLQKLQEKSSSHFNWQKYFYSFLKQQTKHNELNTMLVQNFQNNHWLELISKRQQNFYTFVEYFSKKMAQVGKRLKLTKYSYCSGYNKIIISFLAQMKKKKIADYDPSMIQTSTALLANGNLINIIIPIIVEKTNLHSSKDTNKFLNILSTYLKYLTINGTRTLPEKFNHAYFFKIIKIIVQFEYCYSVAKMLVIIHTYFENFNQQFKQILSLYLLSKAFFRLFFHWSYNVRIIFYHIFIIKIYWSKLNGVTQKENNMDNYKNDNQHIYARYKKLLNILITAQKQKHVKKRNMKRGQKQQYFMKMKRKFCNRIAENPQNQISYVRPKQIASDSSSYISNQQKAIQIAHIQLLPNSKGYDRSVTLCSDEIKLHLKTLSSSRETIKNQISETQNNKKFNDASENLSINIKYSKKRINYCIQKSSSLKQEIQKINQQGYSLFPLTHKKSFQQKPLVYTISGNQDYELEEISLNQQNKILMGMGEFKQTQQFVEKYILEKGIAPHVNLDPEFQIDGNQLRPQEYYNL